MKKKSGKKKPEAEQIWEKRSTSKLARRQPMVPLTAAWKR